MFENSMKYLIVEEKGLHVPIIFHPVFEHIAIAGDMKVISGGFCRVINGRQQSNIRVDVWGESVGCKVHAMSSDEELLEKWLTKPEGR
jgi:hypothetical protein